EIKEIVDLLLRRIRESMAERGLQLELTDEAKDLLVEKGWDPSMGARPLRRAIQRYIEDPLADFVLRSELTPGATIMVEKAPDEDDREVSLTVVEPKMVPASVGGGGAEASDEDGPAEPGGALDQPTLEEPNTD
ncbi:MAG: ATP-dependent Clp protease ATP-binding subunit ClpC, partial [Solirubrobacteraceae bacterium]|nr:ATP-dependent Clp protease ATP-binding subunit ClpC [Solirubrobacteraceae bacterium]